MRFKRPNVAKFTVGIKIAGMAAVLLAGSLVSAQVADAPNPAEWRSFGNGPGQLFYSPIEQINDKNVSRLGLAWSVDLPTKDGPVGNILVANGIAFESSAGGHVYAIDLKAEKLLWQFDPEIDLTGAALTAFIGARVGRGVALQDDKVFVNLPDCRLVALDRATGKKLWDKQTCDKTGGFTQTAPPQVGDGLVFTGNSCMDIGGRRGFITALDQKTGERKWRFYVVPRFPEEPAGGQETPALEMAAKTWGHIDQQQVGCGGSYGGLAYDPLLKLVYVPTTGAYPYAPDGRAKDAGDELFTGSIVALNAETGEYVWHYKLAPHDGWNFEAMQSIVTDLAIDGQPRRVLLNAPKHGFLIMLDAKTGQFISAGKTAAVNWASGFDTQGRPIMTGDANYWEKGAAGAIVVPGISGTHNTQPMSYSPQTGLVYIPVATSPWRMVTDKSSTIGGAIMDASYQDAQHPRSGALVAMDPLTQKPRWQIKQNISFNGGVLSTGGNLVFQGNGSGYFEVHAADTGKLLWSKYLGGVLQGAPTTVMMDGAQYILLPFGNGTSLGMPLAYSILSSCQDCRQAPSRILAFKLDAKQALPANPKPLAIPRPPLPRFTPALAAQGKDLFAAAGCDACHGMEMINAGGTPPDLHRTGEARHKLFADIVRGGLLNQTGMPRFPSFTQDDLTALQAYIINGAWDAYEAGDKKHVLRNGKLPDHAKGSQS